MALSDQLQSFLVLAPIVGLFLLGFALTLRSGLGEIEAGHGLRQLVGNFYQTILVLCACLVSFAVIHRVVGMPTSLVW